MPIQYRVLPSFFAPAFCPVLPIAVVPDLGFWTPLGFTLVGLIFLLHMLETGTRKGQASRRDLLVIFRGRATVFHAALRESGVAGGPDIDAK